MQAAILATIGRHLAPDGVAFISYNAFPGCRSRQTIRDFLRFATGGLADPQQRVEVALAALRSQVERWSGDDPMARSLVDAARKNIEGDPSVLFHDEMGDVWEPQFLTQIVAAAGGHGLAYLADADPALLQDALFPSPAIEGAGGSGDDWVRIEQASDFTQLRAFRTSLFVRAGAPIARVLVPERLEGLWVAADLSASPSSGPGAAAFEVAGMGEIETDDADVARLLADIARCGAVQIGAGHHLADIAEPLLRLFVGGVVTLSTMAPGFMRQAPERPLVSPLARAQTLRGDDQVSNLMHGTVRIKDAFLRRFLALCDGTRDHAALARIIEEASGRPPQEASMLLSRALSLLADLKLLLA